MSVFAFSFPRSFVLDHLNAFTLNYRHPRRIDKSLIEGTIQKYKIFFLCVLRCGGLHVDTKIQIDESVKLLR